MSRLTKRWGADAGNIAGRAVCEYLECDTSYDCEYCYHSIINNRLADYEDKIPYERLDEAAKLLKTADLLNDIQNAAL